MLAPTGGSGDGASGRLVPILSSSCSIPKWMLPPSDAGALLVGVSPVDQIGMLVEVVGFSFWSIPVGCWVVVS